MEVKNLPKEKDETLNNVQTDNLFTNLVLGKDVTEKIETSRGEFEIKYPRMRDLETIGRRVAIALNGLPTVCFDINTFNLIQDIATLDTLVLHGPAWFENAKKENNFTWADCPLQSFIQEVAVKVAEFRNKVQELLEPSKGESRRSEDTAKSGDDDASDDLFSGMSNK